MRKIAIVLFLFSIAMAISAQTEYKNREFAIDSDNDAYLLGGTDIFYTNGLMLNYRWVRPSEKADSVKRIFDIQFTHKIFTPQFLSLTNVDDFERPYAGILTLGLEKKVFPKPNFGYRYGGAIGLTGKASGAQFFQEWYHNVFGFPAPQGWDNQIPNELIFGIQAAAMRQLVIEKGAIDLILESRGLLGTDFINVQQHADIRIGKLQQLNHSSFANSLIGKGSGSFEQHNYLFFGYGAQYVLHDITIEGSLWNNDAPHSESAKPFVRHWRVGWATVSKTTTFKLTYHGLSEEIENTRRHGYISIELAYRLKESRK